MTINISSLYNEIASNIQSKLPKNFDSSGLTYNPYRSASQTTSAAQTPSVSVSATGVGVRVGVESESVQQSTATEDTSEIESFQNVLAEYLANYHEQEQSFTQSSGNATEADSIINASILEACAKYNVDVNLIKAVIRQESNYNPSVVSSAGAIGLMQLMPSTAEGLGVIDPYSISENIDGGTNYLKQMLEKFNGDEELALAAYNAGPGAVLKYGGIPPYKETENYVPSVLGYKEQYLLGQLKNF